MNKLKLALLGLIFSSAGSMAADCTPPEIPTMPNGASASMEQMLEGQQAVISFQEVNLEYMSCLDPLVTAATEKATAGGASKEDKAAVKALEELYNSAVSSEEELAGQFNTEIREYKAANPG
jgi:hypothetical protein